MVAPIAAYESFLLSNVSTISTLESTLRSLTWLLPGRFKDAEFASEALSALLNVASMYHDTILAKIAAQNPKYRPLIPPSLHTRYTRAWASQSPKYKWTARTLELVRFTQLLFEMQLHRRVPPRLKWRAILLLEAIKAFLRLVLLRLTRRPLINPPVPERDWDPDSVTALASNAQVSPLLNGSSLETPSHIENNRVPADVHPLLVSNGSAQLEDYLLPKALSPSSVKPALSLVRNLSSPLEWTSEILYILRPLVYVYLLSSDPKSRRPLVFSLSMELVARALRRSPHPTSALERSEYGKRDSGLVWYLLRGAVWENFTRPKIVGVAEGVSRVPVLNILAALAKDWVPLIDQYYYYTAL